MILDLIRSHAALYQFQREKVETNGRISIQATEEDFWYAVNLYSKLNGEHGGQVTKWKGPLHRIPWKAQDIVY